jgi:ceramide glucosyltransferase
VIPVVLLAVWLAASLAYQIGALAALWRFLSRVKRAGPAAGRLPSCSILRPLSGSIPSLEENLESLCALGEPVVAGVDGESDAAAPVARLVAGRHPAGRLEVRIGTGPEGANRKVANLIRMLPEATGEIVVLTDADVGVPPDYLSRILPPFGDPRVGLVTCAYRSVGGTALAQRLDVILTNTHFLPSVLFAARWEGLRFALGATIAVRRNVLDEVGGFEPLLDTLADDHALAAQVMGAGHRLVMAPVLLDHHVSDERWGGVWRRHLRWARTTRAVRPGGYAGTILIHGMVPALALAATGGPLVAAAAQVSWGLVRVGGAASSARPLGLSARDVALVPLVDLVAVGLYLGGLTARSIEWGGERYLVRRDGTLARPAAEKAIPSGKNAPALERTKV